MLKIKFLLPILILLLSACGFQALNHSPINAQINSSADNNFALELKKHFSNAAPSFIIFISAEMQKQRIAAYTEKGQENGYRLSLDIPIKVFTNNKKLLWSKTLNANIYIDKIGETQSNRLQINQSWTQLRAKLIKQFLTQLHYLHANQT